jgi:hypothetical protein
MQDSPSTAPGAAAPTVLEPEAPSKRGLRMLLAVALAVYAFLLLMAYYEPITGDGWFISSNQANEGASLFAITERMRINHAKENPRLVQLFTMYTYAPGVHVIVTPLIELLLIAHAIGQPKDRRLVHRLERASRLLHKR